MSEEFSEIICKPVGFVRSPVSETPDEEDWWKDLVSEIIIDESLTEALDQIEFYKYLTILYWIHKRDRSSIALRLNPKGRKDIPMRGIFATRTPDRPNPIGLMTVQLLGVKGNVLTVKGLDALDGSPVLDIKPWNAGYDSPDGETASHD